VRKLFLGISLLLCSFAPAYAATVNVNVDAPANPLAIVQGDTFMVTVSNVDFELTGGATLGVNWNPVVLNLVSLSTPTFDFLDPGAPTQAQQDAGEISFFSLANFVSASDQIGNFDSITLEFFAQAPGDSAINIDESDIRGWNRPDASIIDGILYNQASVTVSAVPVPAAVWLFGSALGLLGWIRRQAT